MKRGEWEGHTNWNEENQKAELLTLKDCEEIAFNKKAPYFAYTNEVYNGFCKILKPNIIKPDLTTHQGYGYKLYESAKFVQNNIVGERTSIINKAFLFQKCNYNINGNIIKLTPGAYNYYELSELGLTVENICSIKPNGFKITLFSFDNFQGDKLIVNKDINVIKNIWDFDVYSLIVERLPPPLPVKKVNLFQHYDFNSQNKLNYSFRNKTYVPGRIDNMNHVKNNEGLINSTDYKKNKEFITFQDGQWVQGNKEKLNWYLDGLEGNSPPSGKWFSINDNQKIGNSINGTSSSFNLELPIGEFKLNDYGMNNIGSIKTNGLKVTLINKNNKSLRVTKDNKSIGLKYNLNGRTFVIKKIPKMNHVLNTNGMVDPNKPGSFITYQNNRWENGDNLKVNWYLDGPNGRVPPSGKWYKMNNKGTNINGTVENTFSSIKIEEITEDNSIANVRCNKDSMRTDSKGNENPKGTHCLCNSGSVVEDVFKNSEGIRKERTIDDRLFPLSHTIIDENGNERGVKCKVLPPLHTSYGITKYTTEQMLDEDSKFNSISDGFWSCKSLLDWKGKDVCINPNIKHYDWAQKCPINCAKLVNDAKEEQINDYSKEDLEEEHKKVVLINNVERSCKDLLKTTFNANFHKHTKFDKRFNRETLVTLPYGNHNIDKIRSTIGNDKLSYVDARNVIVTLYQHANFRGRSLKIENKELNLVTESGENIFNDAVSSIRIERRNVNNKNLCNISQSEYINKTKNSNKKQGEKDLKYKFDWATNCPLTCAKINGGIELPKALIEQGNIDKLGSIGNERNQSINLSDTQALEDLNKRKPESSCESFCKLRAEELNLRFEVKDSVNGAPSGCLQYNNRVTYVRNCNSDIKGNKCETLNCGENCKVLTDVNNCPVYKSEGLKNVNVKQKN